MTIFFVENTLNSYGVVSPERGIIEYQAQLGGKIHVYPEKMIWDVGGQTPIPAAKLIDQLVEQGLTFQHTVILNEKVEILTMTYLKKRTWR